MEWKDQVEPFQSDDKPRGTSFRHLLWQEFMRTPKESFAPSSPFHALVVALVWVVVTVVAVFLAGLAIVLLMAIIDLIW